jgi:tripartite-type tricarboxylate transporter receptor subunit TctC
MNRSFRAVGCLLFALAALSMPAAAQDYPSRPIRLIASTAPGTAVDVVARFLATRLPQELPPAVVVVENKLGANGIIATDYVAKSPPDGYTLLITAATHHTNKWLNAKLPYDAIADFKPVARVGNAYLVLVVPSSSPITTTADLIAEMKAKKGQFTYGSAGNGSTTHLGVVLFTSMAGTTATHIPYKGAAQALMDTIGGQVQLNVAGIATALPHIKSGRLRAIAVTGPKRSQSLPDVPTVAETGMPGYEMTTWMGVFAPRATPPDVTAKLSRALVRIGNSPEFREFCAQQGVEVDVADEAVFTAEGPAELERWKRVIDLAGVKAE